MQRYQAKYFDGRSPVSVVVDVFVEDGHLMILDGEKVIGKWPIGALFRDPSHMVSTFIGCGGDDSRLEISSDEFVKSLNITPQVWSMDNLMKMKKWIALWAVIVVVSIAAFIWQSRLITRVIAMRIPPATEKAIFDKVSVNEPFKICQLSDSQKDSLNKVVKRLIGPQDKQYPDVEIGKMEMENAFTLPGGHIIVLSDLLKHLESPDELAGVLAHEIEHLERRHVMEALVRGVLYTAILNFSFGDVSGILLVDPSTAAQFYNLRLSREMEAEADSGAVTRLSNGHISTKGAADFFKRMEKAHPAPKSMEFLYTHPSTDQRVRVFQIVSLVGKTDPPLLTDAEWQDLKRVCQ